MEKSNSSLNGKRILLAFIISFFILSLGFLSIQSAIGKIPGNEKTISLNEIKSDIDFSTFLGGNQRDYAADIVTSINDGCYVVGTTPSDNFPTLEAYNDNLSGGDDVFISEFSKNGTLQWSTFFGGDGSDICLSVDSSSDGSCYIMGHTSSLNFPLLNAYDSTFNGGYYDAFVAKFDKNKTLLWSTYIGGNGTEFGHGIAVASDGSCFIAGMTNSPDFPIINGFDDTNNSTDSFVAKFSNEGVLQWSTYLGGSEGDGQIYGALAVANDDSCYVVGSTYSDDFPVMNAYDASYNGNRDIFVTKFSTSGSLLMSTYLGGNRDDDAASIAFDNAGSYYVTGSTGSRDYPTLRAYDNELSGSEDICVTKFSSDNDLLWSTYLGGNSVERCSEVAVDSQDNCYIVGSTSSNNYPTEKAYDSTLDGTTDGVITIFSSQGELFASTYLGGVDNDACSGIALGINDALLITGITLSINFPIKNGFDSSLNDESGDGFVTRFTITDTDDTPLIIGLIIGGSIIVIASGAAAYYYIRKKRKAKGSVS